MADSSTTPKATWAVVFVHGVGDTAPGATSAAAIPALLEFNKNRLEETERPQNRLLVEPAAKLPPKIPVCSPAPSMETAQPAAVRFPMHLRRFRVTRPQIGQPIEALFAEVFWADLAAASESRWDLLTRMFTLIFDLRHLANVAVAYTRARTARLLGLSLYLASWLMSGPIAGMTLFMVYLMVSRYAVLMLFQFLSLTASAMEERGVMSFNVIREVLGYIFRLHSFKGVRELGMGLLGAVAVLVAAKYYSNNRKRETNGMLLLGVVWFMAAGIITSVVAILRVWITPSWPWETTAGKLLAERLLAGTSNPGTATLSTHLALFFGLIYVFYTALAIVMTIAFFTWVVTHVIVHRDRLAGPTLDAGLGTVSLQVELFVIVTLALGLLVLGQFFPATEQYRHPLFTMMITGFTLKLIFAMMIAVCGAAVWLLRRLMIKLSRSEAAYAHKIPRLLVNSVIIYPAIVLTLYALLTFAYWFCTGDALFHKPLQAYSGLVAIITIPVTALIVFFFRKGLRSWLHIMADITNHFYRPRSSLRPIAKLTERDNINTEDFIIQQRIEARFRRVLEEVLKLGDVTHVTIVAHSQGTITAIDVLWLEWTANLLAGKEVYLVTMGSPFNHLYQHYFPHRYPPLFKDEKFNENDWGSLRKTIRTWTNIYRIDDFIGTRIDGDPARQFPTNRCLSTGGHTRYWEKDVLEIMSPFLPGADSSY